MPRINRTNPIRAASKTPTASDNERAANSTVPSAVNTLNRTSAKRNTAPNRPLNQKKRVTFKPTPAAERFIAASQINPSATARLINQNTTPRPVGTNSSDTLVVEVAASANPSRMNGTTGSVTQRPTGPVHKHVSTVRWNGRRWQFKLEIPIDKPITSDEERKKLDAAIIKAREIFLADLKSKTNEIGTADFNFVFTENGYQAYTPNENTPDMDPYMEIEDALQNGLVTHCLRVEKPEDTIAKKLSDIIQSGDPNLADYINREIDNSPELFRIYQSTQKQKAAESAPGSFHPVGFKNDGQNLCYLNTAVQQWASNPVIRKELLKPDVLKGGIANPLHKILTDYEAAQQTKNKTPLDLSPLRTLLGFAEGVQQDEHIAIGKLLDLIDFDKAGKDSPLYSLSKSSRTDAAGNTTDIPRTDSITGKSFETETPTMAKKTINPTPGSSVSKELKAQQTNNIETNIINLRGTKTETFTAPPAVLTVHVNRTKNENGTETKDPTEIEASDGNGRMELAGDLYGKPTEKTSYNLMSFSQHIGGTPNGGHYKTYVKDGQTYWEISDADSTKIAASDFYAASKTAYVLIYNKEGVTASSVTPLLATPAPASTPTATPIPTLVAGSSTPTVTRTPTPVPAPAVETTETTLNDKVTLTTTIQPAPKHPDAPTAVRVQVRPNYAIEQLHQEFDNAFLSSAKTIKFDLRQRANGVAVQWDNGPVREVHLDIRDFGIDRTSQNSITAKQAFDAFETQFISFLGKNPDNELKIELIVPDDEQFKIEVQKLKSNIAAILVGAKAPETYVKRDNFDFFYQGAINETPFLVETTNEAATQPVASRGGDYANAIKTHLASIAAGRIPYDKEEFIIDLRPGDVRSGESLTNKMYFRIGDYNDIEPQAALDALLKEMETFTNPKKKKIRLILPASLSIANRVKIRNTLANIPAAPATTVPVSPPKNSNLLYRVWDSAVSWIPTIATAATMLTR